MLVRILDSGGIPTHVMDLALAFRERGWTMSLAVDTVIGQHSHGIAWFEGSGIPVHRVHFFGPSRSPRRALASLAAFVQLVRICRREKPDVLHVHFRSTSVYARVVELLTGTPFVTTLHLTGIPRVGVFRYTAFWGSRSIAISSETYQDLTQAFSVAKEKVVLIHNGADPERFTPAATAERLAARATLGLAPSAFTLCSLGRLVSHKRHIDVIDAVALLRDRGHEVQCVIAGVGELRADLQAHVSALGLDHAVILAGYADPCTVYQASDVHVLASLVEGFPLVVVEAMLAGVPTIRTPAAGAVDQIREGEAGFLVGFRSPQQIADRVADLLLHPQRLAIMAQAGRRDALSKFTTDHMAAKTLEVYESVMGDVVAAARVASANQNDRPSSRS